MSLFASVVRNGVREFLEGVLAEPGDICHSYRSSKPGWLITDGKTISKTDVTADYTGTQYEALFEVLLDVSPNVGDESWDGGDKIFIPDHRGRVVACLDDAGGTAANRITESGSGLNGTTLGASGGLQNHTQTEAQLPEHDHPITQNIQYTVATGAGAKFAVNDPDSIYSGWSSYPTRSSGTAGDGEPFPILSPTQMVHNFVRF